MLCLKRKRWVQRLLVVAAFGGCLHAGQADSAHAALITYDLRVATTGHTGGVTRLDDKSVTVSAIGDTVMMNLYAVLNDGALDGDSANDGVIAAHGALFSGIDGLEGGLAATRATPFSGLLSNDGAVVDLDGDGDADVGATGTAAATAGYFAATSTATSGGLTTYTGGAEALLGQVAFTVTSLSGSTSVNFVPRAVDSGPAAQRNVHTFTIDGVTYQRGNTATGNFGDVAAGLAVQVSSGTVSVPEPSSLLLVPAALVAHSLRRRRR